MEYLLKYPVEAQQVTVDNLWEIADWINGGVIGLMLSPECRAVLFANEDQKEHEADVGMWIARIELEEGRRYGFIMSDEVFKAMFK